MSQPVVFISKDFFIHFCKTKDYPTNDIERKKILLFFEELIFYKATIYINIDDAEIINYEKIENISELSEDEKVFSINLKRIVRQNRARSCKKELAIFSNKKYTEYDTLPVKPNYILSSFHTDFCREIEKEFGVICISKELNFKECSTRVAVEVIESNKPIDLLHFPKEYPVCNSLIIEDPYLFANDEQGSFLISLLKTLLSQHLKVQITVTLIFDNSAFIKNKFQENKLRTIFGNIKQNLGKVNIEQYYSKQIHDRNIYSNTFWLSCDYGFKKKYNTATKWTIFPLAIYYPEYLTRKQESIKFIKNEKIRSENYLVNNERQF